MKTLLLAAALAVPFSAIADIDTDTAATSLNPVIVTATRSDQPENRLPASVTVITHDDIVASGATNIVQMLRGVAGAQVTDFYGDGSDATVDLRGFGDSAGSNTLVLVDGRKLNNSDIASPDINSVSLKDVERIEVIHGSAGTLYGDQAVGGVINIITRKPVGLAAEAEAGLGSYRGKQARGSIADSAGGFSFRLSGEGRGSDNYRAHNHVEYENGLARTGYDYGSGGVFLEWNYVNERLQTPGALFANEVQQDPRQSNPTYQNDFSNARTGEQRLNWTQALSSNWHLETDISHRHSAGVFRLSFAGSPPSTQDSTQHRNVWALNPRVTGGFQLPAGKAAVTIGVDAQHAEYALQSPFGLQTNDQRLRDVYAQLVLPLWHTLEATVGGRTARVDNRVFDGFTFTTPTNLSDTRNSAEAGLAIRPLPQLRLFTRYDGNFRFAKVDEFTNAGPMPAPGVNPLRTQHGSTYELGGEWTAAAWTLRTTLYRLQLRDEIVYDPNSFININLPSTRRDGLTVEGDWQALEALKLSASYSYLDGQVHGSDLDGKQIPMTARNNGRFAATVALPYKFSAYAETLATGTRRFSGDFSNSLGKLPGYAVVNLALNNEFSAHWRASFRLNNLLNHQYSEYGSAASPPPSFTTVESFFPSPGRNFWLSVGYSL
ncbi:MAG: TonB-dependent receptor [Stenotrophobium sp.]